MKQPDSALWQRGTFVGPLAALWWKLCSEEMAIAQKSQHLANCWSLWSVTPLSTFMNIRVMKPITVSGVGTAPMIFRHDPQQVADE